MAKNLISERSSYNQYYGSFRGVDFSSDHSLVSDQRLAYLVNMYKDYRSGQGGAIETIPGFRKRLRFASTEDGNVVTEVIHGIHTYTGLKDGEPTKEIIIHAGKHLYKWDKYPYSHGIVCEDNITLTGENTTVAGNTYTVEWEYSKNFFDAVSAKLNDTAIEVTFADGAVSFTYDGEIADGSVLHLRYYENGATELGSFPLEDANSTSFMFNNRLYILDGNDIYSYNGDEYIWRLAESGYEPTTYRFLDTDGAGTEWEQKNILRASEKIRYVWKTEYDVNTVFHLPKPITEITKVLLGDEEVTATLSDDKFSFTISGLPNPVPEFPEDNDALEITVTAPAKYILNGEYKNYSELLKRCRIATLFDNRIFLSGCPDLPNHIFFNGLNDTGESDPTYFGILNTIKDGVENAPITGMIPIANTLAVLKRDTVQDGSVYYHTRLETEESLVPVTYPATPGLHGVGCLGACTNFFDDPVFVSSRGLEGIGQLSVRYERAIEHRSTLIDAKLTNLNLENAKLTEWDGYLFILVDGKVFMADSRQISASEMGNTQYEWYYLEDIGVWEGSAVEYYYAPIVYEGLTGVKITHDGKEYDLVVAQDVYDVIHDTSSDLTSSPVTNLHPELEVDTKPTVHSSVIDGITIHYCILPIKQDATTVKNCAVLVEDRGSLTGGEFHPATNIYTIADNVFFATDNGYICSFNFDKRNEFGEIGPEWYTFDGHTIFSGCATKMDNCGIPHLTKSTVKKSVVIKTKALISGAAKFKVRTNKDVFKQVGRINSRSFSFDNIDFSDFSFDPESKTLHSLREKEKQWVEKQYFIYSNEYQKPFALHYIAFRYMIAGRYKE